MNCPNCTKRVSVKTLNTPYAGIRGIRECPHCGAIFGQCYLGDSYRIVLPYWHDGAAFIIENSFYYDLTVIGSKGITRRHGWADKTTRRIIQIG